MPGDAYARLCVGLRAMGRIRQEALGVTYVDNAWGFLVIPPAGFPELKINFYHGVSDRTAQAIMERIDELLSAARNQPYTVPDQTATSEQK